MSTTVKTKKTTSPRARRVFAAKVKCEAVLAVWAERRKPSEICRELGIPWQQLQSWQRQAMEAMMASLQPRKDPSLQPPALGTRVQKLIETTERRVGQRTKLEKRLERIQNAEPKSPSNPS